MNRLAHPLRCLLLALAWLILTPVLPHLHAHAMGAGSADAVSGLHAPWAHDAPGPSDSEFIAEVEDARKLLTLTTLPTPVSVRWRSAAVCPPRAAATDDPVPPTPPQRLTCRHPQAP